MTDPPLSMNPRHPLHRQIVAEILAAVLELGRPPVEPNEDAVTEDQ